jgi:putative transposase
LTPVAANYRWCSAAWFERNAPQAFFKTVKSFKVDRLKVYDEF